MRTIISRLFLLFFIVIALSDAAWGDDMDFMWWRMTGSERTRDMGMTFDFELHLPGGAENSEDVDVLIYSYVRHGTSATRTYGPPDIYRKSPAGDSEVARLKIYSGRRERIELRARTRTGGRTYYAGAVVQGYGESGKLDPDAERVDAAPEWPNFRLVDWEGYYRAQTGTPISVKIDPLSPSVRVFENQFEISVVEADENGAFTYVPPHDKALSRSGASAKKDLIFEAILPDNHGTASFYLPVYRAYYGQTSLKGGLAVMSASVFLGLGFVAAWNRRFRWR